ncbi:MAG: hypothetical protein ACTHK8_02080 [Ginsengibacter sp.]
MNSYTQHIKNEMKTTKERVMQLLRWEETSYADFQYRMGCQYLQAYIPHDPAGIDELVEKRIFWNWWRNHWLARDKAFLMNHNIEKVSTKTALAIYKELHNPEVLAYEIYPNGAVLTDSYAKMIGDVIKSEV